VNKHLLRQIQQMQARLQKIQEELEQAQVTASAGGGAVQVTVSGKLRVLAVKIHPSAVDPDDLGMLEEMVQSAVNSALDQAQALAQERLSQVTGGMKIPGMM